MRSYLKNTKLIIPSLSKTFNFVKKFDLIEEIPGHNLLDKEERKKIKSERVQAQSDRGHDTQWEWLRNFVTLNDKIVTNTVQWVDVG